MINATNNNPCRLPAIVTAIGIPAKYFRGMATNNNTRKEIPSAKAIFLNHSYLSFIPFRFPFFNSP
jgi:hypothetical protein